MSIRCPELPKLIAILQKLTDDMRYVEDFRAVCVPLPAKRGDCVRKVKYNISGFDFDFAEC